MRRITLALLTCMVSLTVPGLAQSTMAPNLQTVLDESAKAIGADALPRIQGWHIHGGGTAAGLKATFDNWIDRSTGAEATYAKLPPVSMDGGYDGHVAWSRDQKGVVWADGSLIGRAQAINQLYRDTGALWSADHGGARIELVGLRTDAGTVYDVIKVTPDGSAIPFEYWFDAKSHLPMRVIETAAPSTTTMTFSDYRDAGGYKIPYDQKSTTTEGNGQTLIVDKVDVDPADLVAQVTEPASSVDDFSIAGGTQTTVPFELVDNHVYLDVMLDGKGPYRFIFDTGGQNVIDPDVAKEIGAGAVGSVQGTGVGAGTDEFAFANVSSLRVGQAELKDQTFVVTPVRAGFGVSASERADGLIGWEVLARFVTTFDYGRNQLTLRTVPAQVPGKTTAFVFGGTQPQMPCTIDAIPTICSIDTGSRAAIDLYSPFVAAHPAVMPANATAPGFNGFGVGGAAIGRLGRLRTLELGGYALNDVIAGFSTATQGAFASVGVGGNVGGAVWRQFSVTFDYPRQTITLEPDARFGERGTWERAGMYLINHAGKIVVANVRAGTPAAAAGISKGDVIAAIDGTSGAQLTLASARAAFLRPAGTVLTLQVQSPQAAAPRTVKLTLRDYV